MAKIVKTSNQEIALKIVTSNIRLLAGMNAMLRIKEETAKLIIVAGKEKLSIPLKKPFCDEILKNIQKRLAAETKILAKKHAILLEDKELEVLKEQLLKNINLDTQGKTEA